MSQIKYYNDGKRLILYNRKIDKVCFGSLLLEDRKQLESVDLKAGGLRNLFKLMAVVFLGVGLLGYIYSGLPLIVAELSSRIVKPNTTSEPKTVYASFKSIVPSKLLTSANIDYSDFSISIPKLNLASNIIANVDPASQEAYKLALRNGVAQAKGSYLPGQGGLVFLFAHSTDSVTNILQYNAKFYGVKTLEKGDQIAINFNHKHYSYTVEDKKIINPKDLEVIRSSKSDLILSTCYPPGTNWQRLIIFAKLKS